MTGGTTSTILRINYVIQSCYKIILVGHGTKNSKNKYFFRVVVITRHNTTTNCNEKANKKNYKLDEKLFMMRVNDKFTSI